MLVVLGVQGMVHPMLGQDGMKETSRSREVKMCKIYTWTRQAVGLLWIRAPDSVEVQTLLVGLRNKAPMKRALEGGRELPQQRFESS